MSFLSKATAPLPSNGPAESAGRDTSGRRVSSEPAYTSVVDTRHLERDRGYLSGDGKMHQHGHIA